MIKERYSFIKEFSHILVDVLELNTFNRKDDFDFSVNLMLKIAGYNCFLNHILKKIEVNPLISRVLEIPFIGRRFLHRIHNENSKYEISIKQDELSTKAFENRKKFKNVFFASMDTYVNILLVAIEEKAKNGETCALILPYEALNWMSWASVKEKKNLKLFFIEDFLGENFQNELSNISKDISEKFDTISCNIVEFFEYKGIRFGKGYIGVIRDFCKHLTSFQVLFSGKLSSFLSTISNQETGFYITRDRRALENSFVQLGNKISNKTYIINHGLLNWNLDDIVFTGGYFGNVKKVYVFGKHDEEAIIREQNFLNESCPEIEKGKYSFFNKDLSSSPRKTKKILYCLGPFDEGYIEKFSKKIHHSQSLLIRMHPSRKWKIPKYKHLQSDNVFIDDLSMPLSESLKDVEIFVGHASTSILEALYNGVVVFIMNFEDLRPKSNYLENDLLKEEQDVFFADNTDDLFKKIDRVFTEPDFRNLVREKNKKLLNFYLHNPSSS